MMNETSRASQFLIATPHLENDMRNTIFDVLISFFNLTVISIKYFDTL